MEVHDDNAVPGVPELLRATCRELVDLVGADACVLSRVIGELLIEVAYHSTAGQNLGLGHGYLLPDYPLTQQVIERREACAVSLLDAAPDPDEAELLRELDFESLLMLPLEADGECWGLVELYAARGRRFDEHTVDRVEPVLERTAALLESA